MDKYIGKRLDGRYEIQELIGVGGMAYVYKAHDSVDDREVAVKILKDEFLANAEFTRRFKNESKAIAILSHPNIVKVLDVSFGDRMQYIVMEYIDGITLKEYIEKQTVTWKEAVHFTVQILRALQHAHDKGIVHRDIKPQNIMLLADGTIKVTDFGIARFSRNEIRTGLGDKAIGSVHYISPEQARGALTDEKADIYSVGVMMYEMLTGELPFEADNAVSVAIMQLQSQPKKPSDINPQIPEGLEEITLKAMQKDPEKRYQSAAEMLQDINEFKQNPSIRFEYKYFVDETPTRFVEAISSIKGDSEQYEEERKSFPVLPVLAGVAAAFVLVALLVVGIIGVNSGWFRFGEDTSEDMFVPSFVGRDYNSLTTNELVGFKDVVLEYENSADQAKGVVIKQDPIAGKSVKPNARVLTLTLSLGPQVIELPEVNGQKQDQMTTLLESKGLKVKVVDITDPSVPEGQVVKLVASANPVVKDTLIYVYVSIGEKEKDPLAVDNVVGSTKSAAIERLQQQGFIVNEANIQLVNDPDKQGGIVLEQTPKAGEKLTPGEEVVLKVSSGYKDVKAILPLPDTNSAVDLQVYLNGAYSTTYSQGLQGLLPADLPNVIFDFAEVAPNYTITVLISPAGKENFQTYYKYYVDAVAGKATVTEQHAFQGPTTTTTVATTTTTTVAPPVREPDTTVPSQTPTLPQQPSGDHSPDGSDPLDGPEDPMGNET